MDYFQLAASSFVTFFTTLPTLPHLAIRALVFSIVLELNTLTSIPASFVISSKFSCVSTVFMMFPYGLRGFLMKATSFKLKLARQLITVGLALENHL